MPYTEKIIAYAHNDDSNFTWVEKKETIQIPELCSYVSHSVRNTTANPIEDIGRWRQSTGVNRDRNGKIIGVWIKVEAGSKDTYGANVWIGVELTVVVEDPVSEAINQALHNPRQRVSPIVPFPPGDPRGGPPEF